MSNIHKLTGCALPGEVNEDLVAALRDLLARAERGEIVSAAWAHYSGTVNDVTATGWEAMGGTMFQLHSAISMLSFRYAESMIAGE